MRCSHIHGSEEGSDDEISYRLLIGCRGNEFAEGFTPHHHRSKTCRVDILWHIQNEIIKSLDVANISRLVFYRQKFLLIHDQLWGQVQPIIRPGRKLADKTDAAR